ncbi:MAG: 50S ribosomal protein L9 [Candidatus Pacebacteria bacterium]|nr:50S ribosomal protein L9 [Candidatus Paceibacterota bacterium]
MKIVLLQNVAKVGKKYEVKEVANGFALNNLIPKGLAKTATDSVLNEIGNLRKAEDVQKKIREDLLIKNIDDVAGSLVTITSKANDKGHLFAGIHKEELLSAIKEQTRLEFDEDHIVLEEPIKEVGEHEIKVKVGEKEVALKVKVEGK